MIYGVSMKAIERIVIILLIPAVSFAIDISGNISGVWNPIDNPYNITGDLRVPLGDTLIIEPGCFINFTGHYKFNIDSLALLRAVGTENDSIIFTAENTDSGWFGLRFNYSDSNCQLSYCIIQYGRAVDHLQEPDNHGGGVYCYGTQLTITHSTISKNRAWEGCGGGIYGGAARLFIMNNVISSNFCGKGGAGLRLEYSEALIDSNIFEHDTTYYPLGGEWGGGLSFIHSTATLSNNIIRYNFSGFIGGGILISDSSCIHLFNNQISYNRSWRSGAGVYITLGSSVFLNSCLMYSNLMYGGPSTAYVNITSLNSHVSIKNSTFYNGNVGFAVSSPTYCGYDTVINSIIWGGDSLQLYTFNDTLTVLYSNVEGGWPGAGNIDIDPKFVFPDTGNFNLSWVNWPVNESSKSPCIDTGDPSSPLDPDSTRADMGAFFYNQRWNDIDDWRIAPAGFGLLDNYPNPFNSSTTIRYSIPTAGSVMLSIYDILGRKVQSLLDIQQPAGEYQVTWEADRFGSGVYFYRFCTGGQSVSRPMILLK